MMIDQEGSPENKKDWIKKRQKRHTSKNIDTNKANHDTEQ
jgi:hypothetical protein